MTLALGSVFRMSTFFPMAPWFWIRNSWPQGAFFCFCLFRAAPVAYGGSQARAPKELWPAYATATATRDPSHVCDLYHSSRQCWILNPLSEARDPTHVLMDTSWVWYHWTTMGTLKFAFFDCNMRITIHTFIDSIHFFLWWVTCLGFLLTFLLRCIHFYY